MTYYIKNNNRIDIASADALDINTTLAPGNYVIKKDKRTEEFFLETISPFTLPEKLYGNVVKHTNRVIHTYFDRPMSTGVLLTGEKGSGKTMLAKNISNILADANGIPTIVINENWVGDDFNKFVQSIEQPCVILFDEFEKVYVKEDQKKILTLLDGVYPTKKLFIFTCNDVYNINEHLCNRPGRIYYTIRYAGIEEEFIREFCNDRLNDKSHIDQICKVAILFAAFNFDLLQALVEEMNRYNESAIESLKILNAIPEDDNKNKFAVEMIINGIPLDDRYIEDHASWAGNPLSPNGIAVEYRKYDPAGGTDDWEWDKMVMAATDLKHIDVSAGVFVFVNKHNDTITLTRTRTKFFNFNAI